MLNIKKLHVTVDNKEIIKDLDLKIGSGEIHAIMGKNGTGKSTLAHTIAGKEGYNISSGSIKFSDQDLSQLDITQRAHAGIFLGFQYPVEIPGVTCMNFLRSIINSKQKSLGLKELDPTTLLRLIKAKAATLNIDDSMLKRSVNQGFSGGEKKRFEALQILLLEPKLIILDEPDSGLDIDALKTVALAINSLKNDNRSFLIITHYQRLLDYITPDHVHIFDNGKIIQSGGIELANLLEKEGYNAFNR